MELLANKTIVYGLHVKILSLLTHLLPEIMHNYYSIFLLRSLGSDLMYSNNVINLTVEN